ncbi:MAG: hypothetical protein AAFN93_05130 [Bacteroidota bacterium]
MKSFRPLFFLIFIFFIGCSNDDSEPLDINARRITLLTDQRWDTSNRFIYEGSRLKSLITSQKDGQLSIDIIRRDFIYSGTDIEMKIYVKDGNGWELFEMVDITTQNDRIIAEELYIVQSEDEVILRWKTKYNYNGDQLLSWALYEVNGFGEDNIVNEIEYSYDNDVLKKFVEYSYFIGSKDVFRERSFEISGNQVDEWVDNFNDDFDRDAMGRYEYNNGLIESERFFRKENGIWSPKRYRSYNYGTGADLAWIGDHQSDTLITFEYEQGQGNADLFLNYDSEVLFKQPRFGKRKSQGHYIPYGRRAAHQNTHLF